MSPPIGVSSTSVAHETAQELLQRAAAIGARCLDLRAGRGQGWEPDLELIAATLPVAFVAVSARLGAGVPAAPLPPRLMQVVLERGIVLRLFVSPVEDAAALRRFADDVERLRCAWGRDLRL